MSRLLQLIFPLFFACAIFGTVKTNAQCTHLGQVLDITDCGKVFFIYDQAQFVIPSGNDFELIDSGTEGSIDFESTGEVSCLSEYEVVDILCSSFTSLPPGNCDADFSYTEEFDGNPIVAFEPLMANQDLEYLWDFGDYSTSTEMFPIHEYAEQGIYQVCLTLEGVNCTGEATCKTIDLNECHAAFSHETTEDGLVQFFNFSEGNYTQWEWKMGDGEVFTNEVVDAHEYNGVDIYTVCLTVWNDNGCEHEYCDYVFTGTGDVCEFSDCVLPGDTDADQAANVYDLLPIGVAYGAEGPPRSLDDEVSSPAMIWEPQYSPDWGIQTIAGIDYKHIDCNGDGMIEDTDLDAIEQNYIAPSGIFQVTANDQPYFWLEFDFDTVVVDDNTPAFFTLEADLMAGLPDLPFDDLRGFALQMNYPEDKVFEGGGVSVDYNDNSFFGGSNNILQMERDRMDVGIMDMGFTRKSSTGFGFGKVADVSFIVIADVIARGNSSEPFAIDLNGVIAVNQSGAQLTLDQPDESATVIILNKTSSTTDAKSELLNRQVSVFPNPVSDKLWVNISELNGKKLEVFNTLGQLMETQAIQSPQFQVDVSAWAQGVYILHVHTEEGVAKKRVVVE